MAKEYAISKLELGPLRSWGQKRLGFLANGKQLLDLVPARELVSLEHRTSPEADEQMGKLARRMYASRLGCGSREWQISALEQLLMRAEPELPDGRRRIYVCGGDCECMHIACFIENRGGLFVWRDFQQGSAPNRALQANKEGQWERVELVSASYQIGYNLTAGPFYFDQCAYQEMFQRFYDGLAGIDLA